MLEEYRYPNTEPPKFTKVFNYLFRVSLQSDKSYKLPSAKDADNDMYTLEAIYLVKEKA